MLHHTMTHRTNIPTTTNNLETDAEDWDGSLFAQEALRIWSCLSIVTAFLARDGNNWNLPWLADISLESTLYATNYTRQYLVFLLMDFSE